jgi:hypothetical protein
MFNRLCRRIAVVTVIAVALMSRSMPTENCATYLRIKHVGSQDKPIFTMIVSGNTAVADLFRQDLEVKIYVLKEESFTRVISFFSNEATNWPQKECATRGLMEFGSFEVSERTTTGAVKSFCLIGNLRESQMLFARFSHYLSEQKIDDELPAGIHVLLKRIRVE